MAPAAQPPDFLGTESARDAAGSRITVSYWANAPDPPPELTAAMDPLSERITQLEIKLSYAEDLLDTLNELAIKQQTQIEWLLREVSQLRHRDDASTSTFRSLRDELPPHY